MKLKLLTIESSREEWLDTCSAVYLKKISAFLEFEIVKLKSKKMGREESAKKCIAESKMLLEKLKPADFLFLCDEKGRSLNSIDFSKSLTRAFESGRSSVVFVIGGAYGVSEELKSRANALLCLSPMTLSHLTAQAVLYEQLYRALTIWKRLPYHNS